MSGSAQFRFKADGIHKSFIIMIPNRMSFRITMEHNTFHIVRQSVSRNSHTFKSMNHTNKEIFLFCIWKELYIAFPAMMADHCKTSYFVRSAITCVHIYKSPVHLITLTSITGISASTVALRCNCLPFGRNKIFMRLNVSLYRS